MRITFRHAVKRLWFDPRPGESHPANLLVYQGPRNFPGPSPIVNGPTSGSYNPGSKLPVWALPLSLATTYGIDSLSFPPLTEMFHFSGFRVLFPILFRKRRWRINTTRLPHSEISGSKRICRSPKLIAAYHVLHRLLAPRHSLCALQSLIPCFEISLVKRPPESLRKPLLTPGIAAGLAVKNLMFGNQNIIQGPQERPADFICVRLLSVFCSQLNHISPYGCQRAEPRFRVWKNRRSE